MAVQKPSVIRRIFHFINRLASVIRTAFSLLFIGLIIVIIGGTFADDVQPMAEQGALYLAPSGMLVDQRTYIAPVDQILSQIDQRQEETLVREVIEALDGARHDPRITHLLLDTNYLTGGGIAKLEEISNALLRFKESGKSIIAVGDNFSQSQYFLAAHGDEIHINPMGAVMITGFASYGHYFKDALDKLKVNMHIFKAGRYKSAVEPFSSNHMSPAAREQTTNVIGALWQFYGSKIEHLRGLDEGSIDHLANHLDQLLVDAGGDMSLLAKQQGLVDKITTRSDMRRYLNSVIPSSNGQFNHIDMQAYLNRLKFESAMATPKDKIAVVVAKGPIFDGEQPEGVVGGDTLTKVLREIPNDRDIKAVVLRIDSPGGSAFASEIIRDGLADIRKQGIPIVVSMGSYAASGGYWIATEADRVLALATTITGSIGVFGMVPTINDSLAALGIYSDGVSTAHIAGMTNLSRPMTQQGKVIFQAGVDNLYERFLTLVAKARSSTSEEIHTIAQGRVWTGEEALQIGLIDQLGDLNDAVAMAAQLANTTTYEVDYRREIPSLFAQVLQQMSDNIESSLVGVGINKPWFPNHLQGTAQSVLTPLKQASEFNDPRGIYLFCHRCPS